MRLYRGRPNRGAAMSQQSATLRIRHNCLPSYSKREKLRAKRRLSARLPAVPARNSMKVLLACPGIFEQIGGGQRFYANLILNNPTIDFYCFGAAEPRAGLPQNAHFVQPTDVHQRQADEFRLREIPDGDPAEPLKRHPDELARLLDLAASVPATPFDVVD